MTEQDNAPLPQDAHLEAHASLIEQIRDQSQASLAQLLGINDRLDKLLAQPVMATVRATELPPSTAFTALTEAVSDAYTETAKSATESHKNDDDSHNDAVKVVIVDSSTVSEVSNTAINSTNNAIETARIDSKTTINGAARERETPTPSPQQDQAPPANRRRQLEPVLVSPAIAPVVVSVPPSGDVTAPVGDAITAKTRETGTTERKQAEGGSNSAGSQFYLDAAGRLRRPDGTYASKIEVRRYQQEQNLTSADANERQRGGISQLLVAGVGKLVEAQTSTDAGEAAGVASGGSFYLAGKELLNAAEQIKDKADSAGVGSLAGIKGKLRGGWSAVKDRARLPWGKRAAGADKVSVSKDVKRQEKQLDAAQEGNKQHGIQIKQDDQHHSELMAALRLLNDTLANNGNNTGSLLDFLPGRRRRRRARPGTPDMPDTQERRRTRRRHARPGAPDVSDAPERRRTRADSHTRRRPGAPDVPGAPERAHTTKPDSPEDKPKTKRVRAELPGREVGKVPSVRQAGTLAGSKVAGKIVLAGAGMAAAGAAAGVGMASGAAAEAVPAPDAGLKATGEAGAEKAAQKAGTKATTETGLKAVGAVAEAAPAPDTGLKAVTEAGAEKAAPKAGAKAATTSGLKAAGAGAAKLGARAIPVLGTIAMTGYDAYQGFSDQAAQASAFGLKAGEEATTGQKAAMAGASVLDMGGLVSGGASLLGQGLEKVGVDGAAEAMSFSSEDVARKLYAWFSRGQREQEVKPAATGETAAPERSLQGSRDAGTTGSPEASPLSEPSPAAVGSGVALAGNAAPAVREPAAGGGPNAADMATSAVNSGTVTGGSPVRPDAIVDAAPVIREPVAGAGAGPNAADMATQAVKAGAIAPLTVPGRLPGTAVADSPRPGPVADKGRHSAPAEAVIRPGPGEDTARIIHEAARAGRSEAVTTEIVSGLAPIEPLRMASEEAKRAITDIELEIKKQTKRDDDSAKQTQSMIGLLKNIEKAIKESKATVQVPELLLAPAVQAGNPPSRRPWPAGDIPRDFHSSHAQAMARDLG